MGTDMDLHIEVKIKGEWHHLNMPNVARNYSLFSRMGNVRRLDETEMEPLSDNRGMPEDATVLTKYDCMRFSDNSHSHSWLSSQEVKILISTRKMWDQNNFTSDSMIDVFGYMPGIAFDEFVDNPDDRNGIEDFRFIFWFQD